MLGLEEQQIHGINNEQSQLFFFNQGTQRKIIQELLSFFKFCPFLHLKKQTRGCSTDNYIALKQFTATSNVFLLFVDSSLAACSAPHKVDI